MNRVNIVIAILITFSILACQETKEDLNSPISEKDTYKMIGEEIPYETGMAWIDFYKKKVSEQGRTELLSAYNVSAVQMSRLLASADDLVGVSFHYALDDLGLKHVLVIPVDESLRMWSTAEGRILLDANTGNEISQSLAALWAQNYKNANPDKIWFHFFGKTVFDQMSALPYFDAVEIAPAINILNFSPQLLLIVQNDDLISIGRTADTPATIYDASNACPPCAVR